MMKKRQNLFNPKRKILPPDPSQAEFLRELSTKVGYGGNPEHKMNPGDFGLVPPSGPRPGKSLCDSVEIFSRKEALHYLREGVKKGLISDRTIDSWPKNIWSVTDKGVPLEAQLENPSLGTYHGYPMPSSDPFAELVLSRWKNTHE